ncbi:MAG: branched-chain amino acid ABC transporter permease [Chloroflexi bacterium]|nr:branched-chain amino acid ABC transporter permease [Chloroflexota bacterium]
MEQFGRDEWVSQIDQRRAGPAGLAGKIVARWNAIPLHWRFIGIIAVAALVPFITSNDYIIRVAGTVCLFAILALGLNVVVGYAGLLDLGFVAFYGLGAYAYALLSSGKFNVHWPSWISLIFICVLSIAFGVLLGLPSLRLLGDYLAIVTLGFGLVFVQLGLTLDRVEVPWHKGPIDVTGGSNGLINLDRLRFFGFELVTVTHYYYILLALLVLILLVLYRLNESRIGRAWRAMREDPLATEMMGMPTKRLKLLAFATGSAIAGVTGGIFAAWQHSVFPNNFGTDALITIYAMVVLGGVGSLPGVLLGASLLAIVPELLRSPELARLTYYGGVALGLLILVRPRRNGLAVLAAVVGLGLTLRLIVQSAWPDLVAPPTVAVAAESVSNAFDRAVQAFGVIVQKWIILPPDPKLIGNLAFAFLLPALLAWTRMKASRLKLILLVPLLYLLSFVWETRLVAEPAVTRLLLIGALLVMLMIFRPQGLLGSKRVEII